MEPRSTNTSPPAKAIPVFVQDDGIFPGHPCWPMLVYPGAFLPFGQDPPAEVEARFSGNGWIPAWRYGVYDFDHYHSECHEVLGVFAGTARLQFGGPQGPEIQVRAGDAVLLPAGTGHRCLESSPDFCVVGAYPPGQSADMLTGRPGERPAADARISRVPHPGLDPVFGKVEGVPVLWSRV